MAADNQATDRHVEEAIAAAPFLSGVTVTAGQADGVRTHLKVGLSIAAKIGPVGAEAAPVFKA